MQFITFTNIITIYGTFYLGLFPVLMSFCCFMLLFIVCMFCFHSKKQHSKEIILWMINFLFTTIWSYYRAFSYCLYECSKIHLLNTKWAWTQSGPEHKVGLNTKWAWTQSGLNKSCWISVNVSFVWNIFFYKLSHYLLFYV